MSSVFITGADRNIGLALAREFAVRGHRVFAGRYAKELAHLDALRAEFPERVEIVDADVTSMDSLKAAAESIARAAGTLDILVHNAAGFGSRGGDIKGEIDLSGFSAPYNVNALGAMRLVQAFLPLMQAGERRLCFVSSEAGVVSVAHRPAISSYCMSKTALNMALRLMFNQLQPMGYTFRLYHPGWVRADKGQESSGMGKFDPWETAVPAVDQFTEARDWEDRLVLIDNEGAAWPF